MSGRFRAYLGRRPVWVITDPASVCCCPRPRTISRRCEADAKRRLPQSWTTPSYPEVSDFGICGEAARGSSNLTASPL